MTPTERMAAALAATASAALLDLVTHPELMAVVTEDYLEHPATPGEMHRMSEVFLDAATRLSDSAWRTRAVNAGV